MRAPTRSSAHVLGRAVLGSADSLDAPGGSRVSKSLVVRRAAAVVGALLALTLCGCNSMSSHANNQVGTWQYRQGNYRAAAESFQRAQADDPQNATFAYNLGSSLKHQGDLASAEQSYVRAVHIDPNHQPAYHGLAQLLNDQGRGAEATQMVSSWAGNRPGHAGAQIELAWLQRQNGDVNGAEQSLYKALAIAPNHPIATAQLGELYQSTGQTDRAASMYQRSLQANWMQPQVQSRLALLRNSGGPSSETSTMLASGGSFPTYAMASGSPQFAPSITGQPTIIGQAPAATVLVPQGNDDPAHVRLEPLDVERR